MYNPQKIFLLGLVALLVIVGFLISQNIHKQDIQEIKNTLLPTATSTSTTSPSQSSTSTPAHGLAASSTIVTRIEQGAAIFGTKIVPLELLEDSRCPTNVMCIQAGTVRVRAQVSIGPRANTPTFKLDTPTVVENRVITLIGVEPQTIAGQQIKLNEYRFTFKVDRQ